MSNAYTLLFNTTVSIEDYWIYSKLLDELPKTTKLKVTFISGNVRYGYAYKHEGIGYYLSPRGITMGYRLEGVVSIEKKNGRGWLKVWEKDSA